MKRGFIASLFIILIIVGAILLLGKKSNPPQSSAINKLKAPDNLSGESNNSNEKTQTQQNSILPAESKDEISLAISQPADNQTTTSSSITLKGKTVSNAEVSVNSFDFKADAQGNFSSVVMLDEGENQISVVVVDGNGQSAEKDLTVTYDAGKQSFKILDGVVTAKDPASLTVAKNGKTYKVNIEPNVKIRWYYWGSSSLDEIKVNHRVDVWGKLTDEKNNTILAVLIRDLSIQQRHGSFVGMVNNFSGSTFTLDSSHKGPQTVTLDKLTICVDRKMKAINCSTDLQNGHKVRIKGIWNKANNTMTVVTDVKDYSLPKN